MRQLFFLVSMVLGFTFSLFSQSVSGVGLKAGLNYNANGDYFESIDAASENPESTLGFHMGIFKKFGTDVYLKPELIYTNTKSDYQRGRFDIQKLDLPILFGFHVFGPMSLFGGPSFQYILDADFQTGDLTVETLENDVSMGLHFGIGFSLKKIGVDLRYERGLKGNEAQFLNQNNIPVENRLDTRPNQLILSLSLIL